MVRVVRRRYSLVIAAALAVAVACGDPYRHTNPYDPAVDVHLTIVGPDTLFSAGEVGHYTVQTTPPWPDSGVVWTIDSFANSPPNPCGTPVALNLLLKPAGPGAYQTSSPPLEPSTYSIPIEAWLGSIDTSVVYGTCGGAIKMLDVWYPRHFASKTVVVMQRVTQIQLRCPASHACGPLSVGDSAFVWADAYDALGQPPTAYRVSTDNPPIGTPLVTYASRDSTIARSSPVGVRVTRVTAMKSGATWIVATRGTLADSLQVVVP